MVRSDEMEILMVTPGVPVAFRTDRGVVDWMRSSTVLIGPRLRPSNDAPPDIGWPPDYYRLVVHPSGTVGWITAGFLTSLDNLASRGPRNTVGVRRNKRHAS